MIKYFTKPFNKREFLEYLDSILKEKIDKLKGEEDKIETN